MDVDEGESRLGIATGPHPPLHHHRGSGVQVTHEEVGDPGEAVICVHCGKVGLRIRSAKAQRGPGVPGMGEARVQHVVGIRARLPFGVTLTLPRTIACSRNAERDYSTAPSLHSPRPAASARRPRQTIPYALR